MRKFGIEIEMIGLSTTRTTEVLVAAGIDAYNAGYSHSTSRRQWKVVTDISVGSSGCEVVSPILEGPEGIEAARKAADALDAAGADINRSCGFHLHIDASGISAEAMATIVRRYAMYEAEIDSFMPPSRRGTANGYAQSMTSYRLPQNPATQRDVVNAGTGRYWKVNLKSYLKYGTIEFRHHSGTVNANKIVNWIEFIQAFVAESVAQAPVRSVTQAAVPAATITTTGMTRSQRTVLGILQQAWAGGAYLTPDQVAEQMTINAGSVKAIMSDLRRMGYWVDRLGRPGRYRYSIRGSQAAVAAPAPVVVQTPSNRPDGGLWAGIPAAVKTFYDVRKQTLSAGAS